jgi:hypothetical protein
MTTQCEHRSTEVIPMPEGSMHKYKKVCGECQYFLSWHSDKPVEQTASGKKVIIEKIYPHATRWEQDFLISISKRNGLSEKQTNVWKRLIADYLSVGIIEESDIGVRNRGNLY